MKILRTFVAIALAAVLAAAAQASPAAPLPAFDADPNQTSVSGLSSGAFMAVQLQVAYSKSIVGAGVVAGGPYYCAAAGQFAFVAICMGQMTFVPLNPALMVSAARGFARARAIDSLDNLRNRRIYVFSGTDDSVVRQPAVDATVAFFEMAGVPAANLEYDNKLPAGHAVITPDFGNDCAANKPPYISHCSIDGAGYDQAGTLLQHIYGALKPRVDKPAGQLLAFDQRPFASAATAMSDTGYLYVPHSCTVAGTHCKIHVAIHGCMQSVQSVGDQFTTDTGYNAWADANDMLVLYPQVDKSMFPFNPQGCWDWWGYTGANYAQKSAPQMKAITAMVARLTKPR